MEEFIKATFQELTYQPILVYLSICGFMLLSAFGLPIPEEVVLISAGFVGYFSLNPDLYPPPTADAAKVNVHVLAAIAFLAVLFADLLIYTLGKRFGPPLFKRWPFNKVFTDSATNKIQKWTEKYGIFAVFILRFTPGLRFPGHLMCGAMSMSAWKFIAVDIFAAGISVPTQVLLVAFYGETILKYFTEFKIVLASIIAIVVLGLLIKRYLNKHEGKQ